MLLAGALASAQQTGDRPAAAQPPGAPTGQSLTPGRAVTLHGVLRVGVMAIGGETTGVILVYKEPAAGGDARHSTIDVEVSALNGLTQFNDKAVTVTGTIVEHAYVERGKTLILKASAIDLDEAEVSPPAAPRQLTSSFSPGQRLVLTGVLRAAKAADGKTQYSLVLGDRPAKESRALAVDATKVEDIATLVGKKVNVTGIVVEGAPAGGGSVLTLQLSDAREARPVGKQIKNRPN
ncbi:MAG: hypothetical protein HYV63_19120 [Candidatus Schekmanbacteria bacterium]|nr:hypothetical protein [Candidatus Schekmanbacteria bacterium]